MHPCKSLIYKGFLLGVDNVFKTMYNYRVTIKRKRKIMGKVKNFIMDVEEFVWDFFDEDGNFVADANIKTKEDLMTTIKEKFGNMGVDIAKDEIFAIETGYHFS